MLGATAPASRTSCGCSLATPTRRRWRTRGVPAWRAGRSGPLRADPPTPSWIGRTLVDALWQAASRQRGDRRSGRCAATSCELQADQTFDSLSGGQQARFQILLLELSGSTLLLLDEPTDNLDLVSAEALQDGLAGFEGTVLAVTHDRWFAREFDRFLVFGADGAGVRVPRAGLG